MFKAVVSSLVLAGFCQSSPANATDCQKWFWDELDYRYWESGYSISGVARTSILRQCRSDETVCPPRTELVRRAIEAAKALAIAKANSDFTSEISSEMTVVDGVSRSTVRTRSDGLVFDIVSCVEIETDAVTVWIVAEKGDEQ